MKRPTLVIWEHEGELRIRESVQCKITVRDLSEKVREQSGSQSNGARWFFLIRWSYKRRGRFYSVYHPIHSVSDLLFRISSIWVIQRELLNTIITLTSSGTFHVLFGMIGRSYIGENQDTSSIKAISPRTRIHKYGYAFHIPEKVCCANALAWSG